MLALPFVRGVCAFDFLVLGGVTLASVNLAMAIIKGARTSRCRAAELGRLWIEKKS